MKKPPDPLRFPGVDPLELVGARAAAGGDPICLSCAASERTADPLAAYGLAGFRCARCDIAFPESAEVPLAELMTVAVQLLRGGTATAPGITVGPLQVAVGAIRIGLYLDPGGRLAWEGIDFFEAARLFVALAAGRARCGFDPAGLRVVRAADLEPYDLVFVATPDHIVVAADVDRFERLDRQLVRAWGGHDSQATYAADDPVAVWRKPQKTE